MATQGDSNEHGRLKWKWRPYIKTTNFALSMFCHAYSHWLAPAMYISRTRCCENNRYACRLPFQHIASRLATLHRLVSTHYVCTSIACFKRDFIGHFLLRSTNPTLWFYSQTIANIAIAASRLTLFWIFLNIILPANFTKWSHIKWKFRSRFQWSQSCYMGTM